MRKTYLNAYGALYGETATQLPGNARSINRRKKKPPKRRRIEDALQIRLVTWAEEQDIPLLSIPNAGKRSAFEGLKQKAMGLRPGASDTFLTRMSQGYGGYWIELKSPGNEPTELQYAFMAEMRREGYKAEWFDDFEKARDSILDYLKLK